METFRNCMFLVYGIIGVGVTAFCVWVLPAFVMEAADRIAPLFERIPMNWSVRIQDWFYSTAANIHEYLVDKEEEIGRHRKIDKDINFFSDIVMEVREVNEGRRMPVSING